MPKAGLSEQDREAEQRARAWVKERERFIEDIWSSGKWGKVFVLLFLAALAAPFLFDVILVVLVWGWVWPRAVNVTEQVAALALVFAALHAIALATRAWAAQIWDLAYLSRKRHQ